MNFDQKAVKFLANFYINEGKHWTHGPLKSKSPKAAVLSGQSPVAAWEIWSPVMQEFPEGLSMHAGPLQQSQPICTQNLSDLWLERRPTIVTDLDNPGPTKYQVPDPLVRESTPHPHFSFGRRHPALEGGGRRAWQTVWFQSESPFTQKADLSRELTWPSPADYSPLRGPSSPAFSFGSRRPTYRKAGVRALPGMPRAGAAVNRSQPLSQAPPQARDEKRPNPNIYDILPGCRLQDPRLPAFSMSRSPASASWVSSSHTPGPAAYHVKDCYNSRFPSAPGMVIQGVRRSKRHDTGPFCTL